MGFLPTDYQPPSSGHYLKLQAGDNRIRALGAAVVGNMFWITENDGSRRPVRKRMNEPIDRSEIGVDQYGKPERVKQFVAFPVWNYKAAQVEIAEVTQATILRSLQDLDESPDWGDCRNYDLTIKKSGSGLDTSYTVIPQPPQPITDEIKQEYEAANVNMQALFNGDDPFGGGSNGSAAPQQNTAPAPQQPAQQQATPSPAETNGDVAAAKEACIHAYVQTEGDRHAAMEALKAKHAEHFPDTPSAQMTAEQWRVLEADSVPF